MAMAKLILTAIILLPYSIFITVVYVLLVFIKLITCGVNGREYRR